MNSGGKVCWRMRALCIMALAPALGAAMPEELRIKTEPVYEFAAKPSVARNGDAVTIRFASKGLCDATVAIEDGQGRIVRHLASGVLGVNAPEPFAKNAREQVLTWDGKNDQGEYVNDTSAIMVRVSLGLKAQYEKSLFWEPKRRVSAGGTGQGWTEDLIPVATPEGVYLYDGNGVDHLRLFDHEGDYVRTIYPFPADKLKDVKGLKWQDYPHGYARPAKNGLNQTTFFTSGGVNGYGFALPAAFTAAVAGQRIALVKLSLSRMATDGSSGDLDLTGPQTWFNLYKDKPWNGTAHQETRCGPYSAAFSPDGKRLYLAGYSVYTFGRGGRAGKYWLDGVAVVDYESDTPARIFTGTMADNSGLTPGVACDRKGNVCVANYVRDVVEVYDAQARLLKTIPVRKPTYLFVNPKNDELYVFSWYVGGHTWGIVPELKAQIGQVVQPMLTVFKSVADPQPVTSYPLPGLSPRKGTADCWGDTTGGTDVRAAVDFWSDPVTVWLVRAGGRSYDPSEGGHGIEFNSAWERSGLLLLQSKGNKLETTRDFGRDTVRSVQRQKVDSGHQRLQVNPANRKLYVTEREAGVGGGGFKSLIEIDPDTGAIKEIPVPLDTWAEDLAFDINGNVYLRQIYPQRVMRYDLATWREIPWDYGEEAKDVNRRITSALILPARTTVCASEGGLWVSPKGHIAVSCSTGSKGQDLLAGLIRKNQTATTGGKRYEPEIYPGRCFSSITATVQIWDRHGRLVTEDAVPGMSQVDGLAIDKSDNVYVMSCISRVWDGKKHFNWLTGTVIKVAPRKSKWLSNLAGCPVPLAESERPQRSPDISGYTMGDVWVEGAEWFYGGVGNCSLKVATGCICWQQSRFTLDYYARSFAPEMDQFSVAVLDANGNLIMRIGQYGNADDGLPLWNAERGMRREGVLDATPGAAPDSARRTARAQEGPLLAAPHPRSIGGDEVALMHGCHVATMTDRHLYIGDVGNARIVQVKLGYRAEEKVALTEKAPRR